MSMLTNVLETKFFQAETLFARSGLDLGFKPVFDYCMALTAFQNESQQKNRNALKKLLTQSKRTLTNSIKKDPALKVDLAKMTRQSETAAVTALITGLDEWTIPAEKKKISKALNTK